MHSEHGIARFAGLKTIDAAGAPHDCLELTYQGGDRLYLPVENIELLTRYGSDEAGAQLDKLGGVAWQTRKSRLKQRIRDIAEKLIKVAAAREMKHAPVFNLPEGVYQEFCAQFPYEETEDQSTSIADVLDDLASGRPMDRLICGDVGFGKTEVALRSALVTVMAGKTGGGRRANHIARAPTYADLSRAVRRAAGEDCPSLAHGERHRTKQGQGRSEDPVRSTSSSELTRCSASPSSFRISVCSSLTRSSISACSTRSGSSSCAMTCTC